MDDQTQNQPATNTMQVENGEKKERIDELDVIGGGILKLIIKTLDQVKHYFSPQKPL
jgi:hypothetical protein